MKVLFALILYLHSATLFADETYKFRIIVRGESETISYPDGSRFQNVKLEGGFTDSKGNYGDVSGSGIREVDGNNILINTNVLFVIHANNGSKFWAKAKRSQSHDKVGGKGNLIITAATGKFKDLKNKVCDYAVLITDKFTVIQDHSCK